MVFGRFSSFRVGFKVLFHGVEEVLDVFEPYVGPPT